VTGKRRTARDKFQEGTRIENKVVKHSQPLVVVATPCALAAIEKVGEQPG
jgi:hypothetical protein